MGNCVSVKKQPKEQLIISSSESQVQEAAKKSVTSKTAGGQSSSSAEKKVYKMLLVGPGESGKTTFFKNTVHRTNEMYTSMSDQVEFTESIHGNIIESVKTVINKCIELKEYTDEDGQVIDCRISEVLEDEVGIILAIDTDELDPSSTEAIKKLIQDEGFHNCFSKLRHLYYIPDGAPYFLEHIDRIGNSTYVPTFLDILNCRDRTTGVTHELIPYEYEGKMVYIDLYDVGGQRTERKVWKNIFTGVDMMGYFVPTSEFDQKCIEDDKTYRIPEALTVFKVLNDAPAFRSTPTMLTLTKVDQLEHKLKQNRRFFLDPPENGVITFPSYDGDNSFDDIIKYLLDLCMDQIQGDKVVVQTVKNLVAPDVTFKEEFDKLIKAADENRQKT